jgi:outer membrane protein, multidrug efflux system
MKRRWVVIFSLLLLLLNGCALYTKPKIPKPDAPNKFKAEITSANVNTKLKADWWNNFNDPQLSALVSLAIKNNLNYQVALKNIEIAQTYVSENISNLFPHVDANFTSTRELDSANTFVLLQSGLGVLREYSYNDVRLPISYEVDLWNKIRNSVKQAKADVRVSEEDSKVIRLALISSIAGAYFQLKMLNSNLSNLQQQYNTISEVGKLTGNQYTSGLLNVEPVADVKIQTENIKSQINNLEKQRQILENTIAYLAGEFPEKFNMKITAGLADINFKKLIPPGIPSIVLTARPDIQSAYYQAVSYGYLQKESLANFFPTINLTDMYGYASTKFSNLFSSGSYEWLYGITASEVVFDYAIRTSQYRRSKLQFESALLNYKNIVINAFKEVDNNLSSYKQDYTALTSYKKEVESSREKWLLGKAQYASGFAGYISYLNYKLSYLQSEYNFTSQDLLVYQDVVQTYQALGLGL